MVLDCAAGELGYIPLPGEDPETLHVIAPRRNRLVNFQGRDGEGKFVEHIVLRGLTFAHAAWTMLRQGYSAFQAEAGN